MKTIRNLHESEITISPNPAVMGMDYLGAHRDDDGTVRYHAPETREDYEGSLEDVKELGRIVYAIASGDDEDLTDEDRKVYANPDREPGLCDIGYAYSLWCGRTGWVEVTPNQAQIEPEPNAHEIQIVSGEGDGEGTIEDYENDDQSAEAVLERLTDERCDGDRWAFAIIDGERCNGSSGDGRIREILG